MLYFTIEKRLQDGIGKVPEAAGARWRFYRRISSDIVGLSSDIVGLSSDILESSFYWRKHSGSIRWNLELQDFVAGAVFGEVGGWLYLLHALEMTFHMWRRSLMTFILRGRRTIWWGWRVALLAPRIGNEVSYVTQIIDDIHFAWQAQYLVRLEGGFTCSTHWKWGFICDSDHWWHSFCVAGAVFGEVGRWLFVTGAALRDILGYSRSAKCCILQYKIVSKMGRLRSPKRRVRDDDFIVGLSSDIVGYRRIILESSFYWRKHSGSIRWNLELQDFVAGAVFGEVGGWLYLLRALEMTFHMSRRSLMTFILRGRRSIWWGWRVALLAPRIGNDVSYVTQIIDDLHFAWQAQYLVRLAGDFTFSAHWKWSFICHADHWWRSFCVAGAVFGDVGGWLYLLHALEMTFHMCRRALMTFILRGRRSIWWSASRTFRGRRSTSWHFAWEIAGARNVVFYNTKSSPRWDE